MPLIYQINEKYEWSNICLTGFFIFIFLSLIFCVTPLLDESQADIQKEVTKRAQGIARQVADNNLSALVARNEAKIDLGPALKLEGVKIAVILDMDNRIIAPASKNNKYLEQRPESAVALNAKDKFEKGRETGLVSGLGTDTIVAVEPIKVYSNELLKNVIVAMSLVSIDYTLSSASFSDLSIVYSESFILMAILGGLLLLIGYRLIMRHFQHLRDELDRALKGDITNLSRPFKMKEMDSFVSLIDTALSRIPASDAENKNNSVDPTLIAVSFTEPLNQLGNFCKMGLAIMDANQNVAYINSDFEEVTGIRQENAAGKPLSQAARDESFGAIVSDVLERLGSQLVPSVQEDCEFSGVAYRLLALSLIVQSNSCFVFFLEKLQKDE